MLDRGDMSRTFYYDRDAICYVPYRGKRYFIELSNGSFNEYLANFSSNTRNRIKRQLRYFTSHSGGKIDFRTYASPDEIVEFRKQAIAVSRLSYQSRMGWGFPETDDFARELEDEAQNGRARGYLLMHREEPVAFGLCRAEDDILSYIIMGYDPKFAKFSPGTIVLLSIIQELFTERRFRLFDLGGHGTDFKAFHGTGSVDYARVIWFPRTVKNLILVGAHYSVRLAWHVVARIKRVVGPYLGGSKAWLERHLRGR
jgi:CelD/BcsL family acetyltransferase involved in cellulose biosynthesis